MTRAPGIALLAAICGGLLAGCGGSSAPPPPPAYVAEAKVICHTQLAKLNRMQRPSTPGQAVDYLPPALAIMHRETGMLAALDPPPADRAKFAAALADTRQLTAVLERLLRDLHSGMVEFPALAAAQTDAVSLRAQLDRRFHEAGVTACNE
jgi:hypothetical protein